MSSSSSSIWNDSSSLPSFIDDWLETIDSLSVTQLYGAIVALSVFVCWTILAMSHQPDLPELSSSSASTSAPAQQQQQQLSNRSSSSSSNSMEKEETKKPAPPEPRWHIFSWVNLLAVVIFAWSVADFSIHASTYWNDSDSNVLFYFLLGWSSLLCYFFSFFGVTFVHDDLDQQHQDDENNDTAVVVAAEKDPALNRSSRSSKVHSPAPCAPVCTDKQVPASNQCSAAPTATDYNNNLKELSDQEVAKLVLTNQVKDHELEKRLDCFRAVQVRRMVVDFKLSSLGQAGALEHLPFRHDLDYSRVHGANCESVVGYITIPVGMVGPMTINGESFYIPMATTEGCLVASTNRGAKAITEGGGACAVVVKDGITRAPCVRMPSAREAAALKLWCEVPDNFNKLRVAFESTTSFGKLKECKPTIAGRNVYLRLVCFSGDAMGMNMVSKGSLAVIELLRQEFPQLKLIALSGNMCTDKKAAAINWIEGRGKSVVVEATIPKDVVRKTLKTTVPAIVETNINKNLIGSAMAGVVGGFNAHASNIVTAVFLATGQDPAQNVESSNCITLLEEVPETGDLWISCTMPSIEVGTVGGGTSLESQAACLQALGCKNTAATAVPGDSARRLATVVAAATMAGELSLLAALAANTLVAAHMQHNRKPTTTTGSSSSSK